MAVTSVTPETVVRHELVGLSTRVAAASNADLVGIEGRVVEETTRTLGIESRRSDGDSGHEKSVPKAGTTFEFRLPGPGADVVTVEGDRLVARPARRTERGGGSAWP